MTPQPDPNTKKINWLAFLLEGQDMSMGRLMAWIMFFVLIYMWLAAVLVPETLITAFYVLISYNLGKKITGPLTMVLQNRGVQGLPQQPPAAPTTPTTFPNTPPVQSPVDYHGGPVMEGDGHRYPLEPQISWEDSVVEDVGAKPTLRQQKLDVLRKKLQIKEEVP